MGLAPALISAGGSVLVGLLAFFGVLITNSRANQKMQSESKAERAVTDEKLSELTREVRAHNDFATRIPVLEEKIKALEQRVTTLEGLHRPE